MKNLILISFLLFSLPVLAQDEIVTKKLRVEGNCGSCKKRIEEASYVKGVKRAEWDKTTDTLTVTYNSSKTNEETILQSVAKAGHSSPQVAATDKAYNKLPECCKYKHTDCKD
jgi:mercuric ion binding protein